METTTNYGLKKPSQVDYFDIDDQNTNMNLIDAALSPTADPSQAPSGLSGKLSQWVSWIANRMKAITGTANWYDAPDTTLVAAKTHMDSTANPHATTAAQVGADSSGTAASAVSAHNADSGAHSALFAAKAGLSASATATLTAAGWTGSAAPYSQTVSVSGVTATKNIGVGLSWGAAAAQRDAAAKGKLFTTSQAANSITVVADGVKPTVDLPIAVIIWG